MPGHRPELATHSARNLGPLAPGRCHHRKQALMKHFFRLTFQHARSRLQTKLGRTTVIVVIVGIVAAIFPSSRVVAAAIVVGAVVAWIQMNASLKTASSQTLEAQRPEAGRSLEANGAEEHPICSSDAENISTEDEEPA